jgi:hypothetical protein
MNAYSRGSKPLAGAASVKLPHAGVTRAFCDQLNIAQWVEQQPSKLWVAGSTPAIQPNCLENS